MLLRNTWLVSLTCLCCGLALAGCNNPTSRYQRSSTYNRVLEDIEHPADNDEEYIPPKRYVPKIKPAYEDNDATYVFPKGKLARTPRAPYPQDNDATYTMPRSYKYKNGKKAPYPADNDNSYVYPKGYKQKQKPSEDIYGTYPTDNENDMLDIYPLYMD